MEVQKRFKLRITYVKQNRLAYLSHLEVTGALERAIRRAKLPFGVSQGFSPHMLLSFGSALPVGVGSMCQIFDVTLNDYVNPDVALNALKKIMPADLMATNTEYIGLKSPAASVTFANSTYIAKYDDEIPDFDVPETIEITRKKKKKILNVDDYLIGMPIIDDNTIECTLKSTQAGSLRIDKLLSSFNIDAQATSITRVKQF